jgi:hypothetical protein
MQSGKVATGRDGIHLESRHCGQSESNAETTIGKKQS